MNRKVIEKKEIKRWWEYKRQLRWKNIYKKKDHSSLALNNRMEMILNYFQMKNIRKKKYKNIRNRLWRRTARISNNKKKDLIMKVSMFQKL